MPHTSLANQSLNRHAGGAPAIVLASAILALLAAFPTQAQDQRLSTDCRLNRYSLPCLGYDMETARRMVQEQDARVQQEAAETRRRTAEEEARQQAARNAPVPSNVYGPEVTVKGAWTIFCSRDRMTDVARCTALTPIRRETANLDARTADLGTLHLDSLHVDGSPPHRKAEGYTLLILPHRANGAAIRYRIGSAPAQSPTVCNASGQCAIAVPANSPLEASLLQAGSLLLGIGDEIASASIDQIAEAAAELQRQAARWGVPARPGTPLK